MSESIRNRRFDLNVTKSQAARIAGWSRRTWSDVEEGRDKDPRFVAEAHQTLDIIAAYKAMGRDYDGG